MRFPAGLPGSTLCLLSLVAVAPSAWSRSLSYEAIRSFVKEHEVSSVGQVLERFQTEIEDSSTTVTLMYHSESRQRGAVDALHPRVIFSEGDFVGAVVGRPDLPASYETLEMIQYDRDRRRFRFHQLEFRKGRARLEEDSTVCARCHEGRPIWASYNFWPGAYGGMETRLLDWERERLLEFFRRVDRPGYERYRPFRAHLAPEPAANAPLHLGHRLAALNADRIVSAIEASPVAKAYGPALQGVLSRCSDIESFLPEALLRRHEAKLGMPFPQLLRDTEQLALQDLDARVTRFRETTGLATSRSDFDGISDYNFSPGADGFTIAALRFLVDGQDVDPALRMSGWSMSHGIGAVAFSFSAGGAALEDLFPYGRFAEWVGENKTDEDCAALAEASRKGLARFPH